MYVRMYLYKCVCVCLEMYVCLYVCRVGVPNCGHSPGNLSYKRCFSGNLQRRERETCPMYAPMSKLWNNACMTRIAQRLPAH